MAVNPGLFTETGTGTGQASVVNQDWTINGASNPAPRGSYVALYGTGFGSYNPAGADGLQHTGAGFGDPGNPDGECGQHGGGSSDRRAVKSAMRVLILFSIAAVLRGRPPAERYSGTFSAPKDNYDYVKREEMIPMRDGVKLYTVMVIPKGARNSPIILTRTPYNASARAQRNRSPYMLATLPLSDEVFAHGDYIRVYQDVRGKYGSEGNYMMTRPIMGPLNSDKVDRHTDAWDTIDWLVKHVPETNGRVGMIGSSYEGFTVVMALLNPHPALKAAVPESPMVDGWMGDDWFHYGAFRQPNLDYTLEQTGQHGEGHAVVRSMHDDYEEFPARGVDRRLCAGAWAGRAAVGDEDAWTIPPTTRSGRDRRWTSWWRSILRKCRPSGCRDCGTRRTCGERTIATRR